MEWAMEEETARSKGYAFSYDQLVSQGEVMSTKIISAWLNENGIANKWMDVRDVLITDNTYRDAKINWAETEKLTKERIPALLEKDKHLITQGFIGATSENFTTTLGREGSDYTAAILAFCLNAEEMIVWKDVPCILSSDPRYSDDAIKIELIIFYVDIVLYYYCATIIMINS